MLVVVSAASTAMVWVTVQKANTPNLSLWLAPKPPGEPVACRYTCKLVTGSRGNGLELSHSGWLGACEHRSIASQDHLRDPSVDHLPAWASSSNLIFSLKTENFFTWLNIFGHVRNSGCNWAALPSLNSQYHSHFSHRLSVLHHPSRCYSTVTPRSSVTSSCLILEQFPSSIFLTTESHESPASTLLSSRVTQENLVGNTKCSVPQ